MARRANSGISVGLVAGITAALLGFAVIAFLLFRLVAGDYFAPSTSSAKLSQATVLDLSRYRDDANGLRGNVYQVNGKVEETLRWTADRGRLISFDARDATTTAALPVLVPETFSEVNIERGQELALVVRVDRDGTLVVESIR